MSKLNLIPQIVKCYRAEHNLTQTELANGLAVAIGKKLSKASISYWENGISRPNHITLLKVARRCNDWRKEFALDILAALEPGVYEPAGEIGREVIGKSIEISSNSNKNFSVQILPD